MATLRVVGGLLLVSVIAALGCAIWFLDAVALGHAPAMHLGSLK